ncbi:MAG: extracellular solute-binding protein [bacterium]
MVAARTIAETIEDRFPFGIILFVFAVAAFVSGIAILSKGQTNSAQTLTVASFAKIHLESYEPLARRFEAEHPGIQVKLELIEASCLFQRTFASFMSDIPCSDIVEIEISSVGRFFSGPLEEVGFVDLTDRLHESGLIDEFVPAKLQPWSTKGRIFGLPRDISPVALVYNREEYAACGVNPDEIETWEDFLEAGKRMTRDVDGDGHIDHYAIELSDVISDQFHQLLLQRGIDYFSPEGRLQLENEIVVDTLAFYLRMLAGPERIGAPLPALALSTQAMLDKYLLTFLSPDWRLGGMRKDSSVMSGKVGLMPLPAWEPGGRRTTTWGGTMMSICKSSPRQDLAWDFVRMVYTDRQSLLTTYKYTALIPPVKSTWDDPIFQLPDPYVNNQKAGAFYVGLAPDVPPRVQTPFSQAADQVLNEVIFESCTRCREEGVENAQHIAAEQLHRAANRITRLMNRNPFL